MKISFLFPEKNQGEKLIRHLKEMVLPFLDKQPIAYDVLICLNGCSEEEMELLGHSFYVFLEAKTNTVHLHRNRLQIDIQQKLLEVVLFSNFISLIVSF